MTFLISIPNTNILCDHGLKVLAGRQNEVYYS